MKKIIQKITGRITVTFICLLMQILWFLLIANLLNEYHAAFSSIMHILAFILVLNINGRKENAATSIAWTIIILAVPVFGVLLYYIMGRTGLYLKQRKRFDKVNARFNKYLEHDANLFNKLSRENKRIANQSQYITKSSGYPVYQNTDITYYALADKALTALKTELRKAKHFIFMEYYAIEDTKSFNEIKEILLEKVKEGVEVRVLYDDFGSIGYVNSKFMKALNSQGIKCRRFNPVVPFLYVFMNNRDHRKITVIDGKTAFNGGFNLADEYFNVTHPFGHWKDTGMKITGDAVRSYTVMFLQMWNVIKETDTDVNKYFPIIEYTAKEWENFVQPYADSPLDKERVGKNVYLSMIKNAKHYIYIYTPYFIIDNEIMESLCLAAKSGVDVRIITPGIPDKKTIYMATQSYYPPLIEAGVRIYQYTPGFIHAKGCLSDDRIGVVGTINFDYRSMYLQFECATLFYKGTAVRKLKEDFIKTFKVSEEVTKAVCNKNLFERMLQCILRLVAPLL